MINRLFANSISHLPKKLVWQFSKRYVAGESIENAISVSRELVDQGMCITVDLLGEFVTNLDQASENTNTYLQIIDRFSKSKLNSSFSLKPTSFGLLINEEICFQNIRRIVEKAAIHNWFVRIDMEDSICTDSEIRIYNRLQKEFPENVAIVFQAYLKRTFSDIQRAVEENTADFPVNIRLCKGIYVESEKIAYKGFEVIRQHFIEDLEYLLTHKAFVAIATHDRYLVEEAFKRIEKYNINSQKYEFQMLYGVAPNLRDEIVSLGHPLRIYVPFGKEWFAYCTRRLKENPKIANDVVKALFIQK